MGRQHQAQEHQDAGHDVALSPAPAPGKRAHTDGISPRHHVMTGDAAIDNAADDLGRQDGERWFLDPQTRLFVLSLVGFGFSAVARAMGQGFQHAFVKLATKNRRTWTGAHDIAFLVASTFGAGPLARALSFALTSWAVPAAERGWVRTGWALAGADPGAVVGTVSFGFKVLRGRLAYGGKGAGMTDNEAAGVDMVRQWDAAIGPTQMEVLKRVPSMDDVNKLALLALLEQPDLHDPGTWQEIAETAVQRMTDNRIGDMGETTGDGLDVATVRRFRRGGREYMALLRARGTSPSNGEGRTEGGIAMPHALEFVRLVEGDTQDIAANALKDRRGEHAMHEGRSVFDMVTGSARGDVLDLDEGAAGTWTADAIKAVEWRENTGTLGGVTKPDKPNPDAVYGLHLAGVGHAR